MSGIPVTREPRPAPGRAGPLDASETACVRPGR